jgi:hypothetical protein
MSFISCVLVNDMSSQRDNVLCKVKDEGGMFRPGARPRHLAGRREEVHGQHDGDLVRPARQRHDVDGALAPQRVELPVDQRSVVHKRIDVVAKGDAGHRRG